MAGFEPSTTGMPRNQWPQDRDFEMFQEWFEIERHSVGEDLRD